MKTVEFTSEYNDTFTMTSVQSQQKSFLSKPLVTNNKGLTKTASFKGRGYILLRALEHVIKSPAKVIQLAAFTAGYVASVFTQILSLPFRWNEACQEIKVSHKVTLSIAYTFVLVIANSITDTIKMLAGAVITPKLAIRENL